jgi:hypothetical protein
MATRTDSDFKWQFAPRFRRNAFGWKSDAPIQRIKEAIAEIKQVARKDKFLAAEGAVLFLEKLTPAIEQVDSSSGSLGSAVYRAIEVLVPIIGKADVDKNVRQRWLERLWQDDGISYIESLASHWGELCAEPKIAERWIDEFRPMVEYAWRPHFNGHGHYNGTSACLSAMMLAGQHEQLLALLEMAPYKFWHDRQWGVRALVALGRKAEAIRYAEASRGLNMPDGTISEICEEILLSSGLTDEAYQRYAIAANQGTTHLATFRAIAKKYQHKAPADILRDLVSSTPGAEGKWFAAAKDAGLYDAAIELVNHSPTDPRTLTRAARDYAEKLPTFALAAGFASLRWMAHGYGYEITGVDVIDAHDAVMKASSMAGLHAAETQDEIRKIIDGSHPMQRFISKLLSHHLVLEQTTPAHPR